MDFGKVRFFWSMNQVHLLFLAGCTALGFLFFFVPEIDLRVAEIFYSPSTGFLLNGRPGVELVQLLLAWVTGSFVTICLALLTINNMPQLHRLRNKTPVKVPTLSIIYLLLTLALGPGLLVNGILKQHWGRARPREVVAFGGDKQFTNAFVFSDQCKSNCSFVSGEASLGFFGLAFMFVAPQRRRKTIATASLLTGLLIGLVRMGVGAHFLSDVIFAGVFTYLVSYLLYLFLIPPSELIVNVQTKAVEFYKSYQKAA
jgi:lipid A 4'-phosphatase